MVTIKIVNCAALPNTTTLTVAPDTAAGYALVTCDGDLAGTYSLAVVPTAPNGGGTESAWDDAAVTKAVLNWYGAVAQ